MAVKSLEFAEVRKEYARGSVALHRFSLNVAGGEFITLLGPSGCGKTTALNCLAGLIPLTDGEIRLDGQRVDTLPPERRGFGMVFQNYALFPHLTVEKNVAFGLELRHVPTAEIRKKVAEALTLIQLEPSRFGQRFPRELSGGQQQRLALARAVVLEPQVLLLDEPLSNLDARLRSDMRLELKRLHRHLGLTSVYVTHDQAEALSLSDRVVVMREGRIEQVGTPEEVYRRPASQFVADFLGFKNRVPVKLLQAAGILPSGAEGVACFRAEDVEVVLNGSTHLEADVELVEFLGQEYEAEVRLADGQTRVLLRSPRAIHPGDHLGLNVAVDRIAVFPTSSTPSPSAAAA